MKWLIKLRLYGEYFIYSGLSEIIISSLLNILWSNYYLYPYISDKN